MSFQTLPTRKESQVNIKQAKKQQQKTPSHLQPKTQSLFVAGHTSKWMCSSGKEKLSPTRSSHKRMTHTIPLFWWAHRRTGRLWEVVANASDLFLSRRKQALETFKFCFWLAASLDTGRSWLDVISFDDGGEFYIYLLQVLINLLALQAC